MATRLSILMTGVTGYLGSRLAKRLVDDGHQVLAMKRRSSSLRRLGAYAENIRFFNVDECDYAEILRDYDIDGVIHAATCYGRLHESATDLAQANVLFPLKLLETCLTSGVKAFVNTDTTLPDSVNPYSLSKGQFREWGAVLVRGSNLRFINIKLEHFYGPGDDASKFPVHVTKACLNNQPDLKLTRGEQLRDFIYIDDVVEGYVILLEALDQVSPGRIENYELGSGVEVTIRGFVELVHRLCNSNTALNFGALPYRENEIMCSVADTGRLQSLGWECKTSLESGVMSMIEEERVQ